MYAPPPWAKGAGGVDEHCGEKLLKRLFGKRVVFNVPVL